LLKQANPMRSITIHKMIYVTIADGRRRTIIMVTQED
jgi:hypothetical protein